MKPLYQNILFGLLLTVVLSFAVPAKAVVISYTVDGVAPQQYASSVTPPADAPWGTAGYPGDTVALSSYTGTLDLSLGTSVQKINSLLWTVDYTYGGTATDPNAWSDVVSNISLSRQIQIGSQTAVIDQTGVLTSSWDNDYLTLNTGSVATIDVDGYTIDITALTTPYGGAGSDGGATSFDGNNPWAQPAQDLYAQFVVTADTDNAVAPEPGSVFALMGLSVVAFGGAAASRLRGKKAVIG